MTDIQDLIKRLRGAIVGSHRSVRDDYKLMKEAADALDDLSFDLKIWKDDPRKD